MSRTLLISGALACLVAGAGFLFADGDAAPPKSKAVAAPAPVPAPPAPSPAVRVAWPTPYPYFENKADDLAYLQAPESGVVANGGYGMLRNGGARFHEGVDIRPVARDRKGEATDAVVAALPGRLVYLNASPNGDYGRYVVIEHTLGSVSVYTLYAHLASLNPGLALGRAVDSGAPLGVMGRSNASGGFPRERAHLHFEIGLRLSGNFSRWYAGQKYPDANKHGEYNGINLAGLDPAGFFRFARAHSARLTPAQMTAWLRDQPVAVLVETPATSTPALVRRCPGLVTGGNIAGAAGWRIGFTADGAPVSWTPLARAPETTKVVMVDNALSREARLRGLVKSAGKNRGYAPASNLEKALELLFES